MSTASVIATEVLDAHEKLLIDQVIAKHRGRPGALLGILEAVQSANAHKFLSMESLRYIADQTGVPPARIYSAATFYALFNLDPQGDNVICVCRGTACHVKGSAKVLESLKQELKVEAGQTTRDGLFTLDTVACIGACGLAPVISINGEFHAQMTPEKAVELITTIRNNNGNNN